MWHTLKVSRDIYADFAASVDELLQSTFRNLILITGGIYLLWFFATTGVAGGLSLKFLPATILLIATCALALWLLPKQLMAAQAVWQVGLAITIAAGVYISGQPLVIFFYALLPLLAVVTVGGIAGILSEAMIIVIMWWLSHNMQTPAISASYIFTASIGGIFTGLLGWASARTLVTAVEWSFFGVEQARQNMEEARQHRAKLTKVLKDLDVAYYRLEQTNSALLVARDAAVAAEQFKAEFVANVSHELRTPLNLIIGFSEVMATAPESYGAVLPSVYRGDIMAIYRSAQHLSDLIDDVLDLSQIEAGRMPLTKEAVPLEAVIREATDIMGNLAEARDLQLEVNLPDNLPILDLDRTRIRQVLINLLSNAMRYTEVGRISVCARVEEHCVLIMVEDTGSGIVAERLKHVFEAFSQLEDGHAREGNGLGLALSKKFVELHGGKIWIDSVLKQGTTVSFTLPLPKNTATGSVYLHGPSSSVQYREGQPAVLVLHDDPRIIPFLRRRIDGYQLFLADTPEKACQIIQEVLPIAVIMDNHWVTTVSKLELPAHTLLITCPLLSPRHLGHLLGAADYLPKPITREDLEGVIAQLPKPPQNVLIIDDNPHIVRLLARILKTIIPSVRILEAFSGAEALEIVRAQRPDVLLLDMILPDIDGYSILEEITHNEIMADTQIIITSARNLAQEALPVKGDLLLQSKGGFSQDDILQIVQAMLSSTSCVATASLSSDAIPLKV